MAHRTEVHLFVDLDLDEIAEAGMLAPRLQRAVVNEGDEGAAGQRDRIAERVRVISIGSDVGMQPGSESGVHGSLFRGLRRLGRAALSRPRIQHADELGEVEFRERLRVDFDCRGDRYLGIGLMRDFGDGDFEHGDRL